MSLEKARQIALAVSNDMKIIGVTNEMIGEAFRVSNMAGDFIFEGKLYKNVATVLAK